MTERDQQRAFTIHSHALFGALYLAIGIWFPRQVSVGWLVGTVMLAGWYGWRAWCCVPDDPIEPGKDR